jgi:hypothetical protein
MLARHVSGLTGPSSGAFYKLYYHIPNLQIQLVKRSLQYQILQVVLISRECAMRWRDFILPQHKTTSSSSSSSTLQSNADLHFLHGLLQGNSTFWLLFPVWNFAIINICYFVTAGRGVLPHTKVCEYSFYKRSW